MRFLIMALTLIWASAAGAQMPDATRIVTGHVLPHYRALAEQSRALADAAQADCAPQNPALRDAYGAAFDAWIGVSHLRFGPSEAGDRAFALAFWPDSRGSTPKALGKLIGDHDPIVDTPAGFKTVSIAARGFYALEFLLYDPQFNAGDDPVYLCSLIQAVTADIAANTAAILQDWEGGYGALMTAPGNDTYRSQTEVAQQFFTALSTALEFTADTRLGRPMGTFDRPRPNRAEARRSGRSQRHVILSLQATRELAALLSDNDQVLDAAFDRALVMAQDLDDPVLAGVADPQGRLRVEVLQQTIDHIREILSTDLGPRLGFAAGFNSLDGD
ncbi:imelysin family protein [Actibacterium ureilyticum]|uniref:imelysin family protein n=1 Tax=Actibacterium ureilyticum TaxID=1590614 RepID=UPI000BAACD7B|nr:imelysin family protein [Actibacterium ureilyticum]